MQYIKEINYNNILLQYFKITKEKWLEHKY
jgi:hypothetical protein